MNNESRSTCTKNTMLSFEQVIFVNKVFIFVSEMLLSVLHVLHCWSIIM